MKNVRKPLLDSNALPLSSLGNPFVHSLLVTLGNHAVHDVQTYNWPCPVGPSADRQGELRSAVRDRFRDVSGGFQYQYQYQGLRLAFLWRCLGSTNRRLSTMRRSTSSRARSRTPSGKTK